ncbi:hydrolase [Rhodovibrionaceae bacterium A322]
MGNATKPAKKKPASAPRAWQRMLSGRRLDLLDPSPFDVEIEDIAHGLSRVARWNGQTQGPWAFSVAQHSLLVEEITALIKPDLLLRERLFALLHDAPEFVVGDLISPFKAAVGVNYKALENRLMSAILLRFSLPPAPSVALEKLVKRADLAAAYLEATQLAGFELEVAQKTFPRPRGKAAHSIEKLRLTPLPPDEAKAAFLSRFHSLLSAREKTS